MITNELANNRQKKLEARKRKQLIVVACLVVGLLVALVTMPEKSEPATEELAIVTPVSTPMSMVDVDLETAPTQQLKPQRPVLLESRTLDQILSQPMFAAGFAAGSSPTGRNRNMPAGRTAPQAIYGSPNRKSTLRAGRIEPLRAN